MQQKAFKKNTGAAAQLLAIKANDEAALKKLYESNYYTVEKFVLKNNGCIDQAKDVYQEAFISVWRNIQLDKFHPESENSLAAYLCQIARNKWLDYLRSNRYKKSKPIRDLAHKLPAENTDEEEENNFIDEVKKHFRKLGKNCKEVLRRFYFKRQSMKKIAAKLGWTAATARNNKYRCLQKLRDLIQQNNKPGE